MGSPSVDVRAPRKLGEGSGMRSRSTIAPCWRLSSRLSSRGTTATRQFTTPRLQPTADVKKNLTSGHIARMSSASLRRPLGASARHRPRAAGAARSRGSGRPW